VARSNLMPLVTKKKGTRKPKQTASTLCRNGLPASPLLANPATIPAAKAPGMSSKPKFSDRTTKAASNSKERRTGSWLLDSIVRVSNSRTLGGRAPKAMRAAANAIATNVSMSPIFSHSLCCPVSTSDITTTGPNSPTAPAASTKRLPKDFREMAAAQLRLGGKFGQGEVVCKFGLQAFHGAVDARRHGPRPPPATGLIAHGAQHAHGQSLGQTFKVPPSPRAPAFGFFRQKSAQRLQLLVDRKKRVPQPLQARTEEANLVGNGFAETRRETEPGHPAFGPFPPRVQRQKGREEQDVIAADAVVTQAKLRHRRPRVSLFCPGTGRYQNSKRPVRG
jgi:hypothetical protein